MESKKATYEIPVRIHTALKVRSAESSESMQAIVLRAILKELNIPSENSQTAN